MTDRLKLTSANLLLVLTSGSPLKTMQHASERFGRAAIVAAYGPAYVFGSIGIAATLLFLTCTVAAFLAGWRLPTTALLHWSSIARWLAMHEPLLGFMLAAYATTGALTTWTVGLVAGGHDLVAREERRVLDFFKFCALPIAACALVFSLSAMWAGLVRPGDVNYFGIGGLLQHSDAGGYLAGAYEQVRDGVWSEWVLRRPLAAALRSCLLLIAGHSLPIMLVIQVVILAAAMCMACFAVAHWRGFWSALAFFGLSYTYVRAFAPTALTEVPALIWTFLSIPCLVASLRTGSRSQALFGLGALTIALMTRMGSMFTIPALMGWIVLRRGEQQRVKAGLLCLAVVFGVMLMNSASVRFYGTPNSGSTGGNFSYTLCGLTIGTDWTGCPAALKEEGKSLPSGDKETEILLYRMAFENFKAHPGVLFKRLFLGAKLFVVTFLGVTWGGYGGALPHPGAKSFISIVMFLISMVMFLISAVMFLGLLLQLHRRSRDELLFWILIGSSTVLSAAVVFSDDGTRVLAPAYVLLFLLLALGLAVPRGSETASQGAVVFSNRVAGYASLIVTLLVLCGPGLSHMVYSATHAIRGSDGRAADEWITSRQDLVGFLIVADDSPLRYDIPSLHYSDFAAIVSASGIENDQPLLHPQSPPLPFGFVFAPSLVHGQGSGYTLFIVPPAVLEHPEVQTWRLRLPLQGPGPSWYEAMDAEPVN